MFCGGKFDKKYLISNLFECLGPLCNCTVRFQESFIQILSTVGTSVV